MKLEFDEYGGYDCMSAAWVIRRDDASKLLTVDLTDFCQSDDISAKDTAEKVACICLEALSGEQFS
jgi:hypothetical protein